MLKRVIKVATTAAVIACLVVGMVSSVAFAVDPVSAVAIAGALDAYGMAYGVGTVYDVSSSSGITDSFSGLWDQFSSYQTNNNASLPTVNGVSVTYDDYIDEWQSNYRSLHSFSHSSGNFAAWSIDSESAAVFDQFWNWLLTGPAEMVRVDNQFQFSSSQIGPSAIPIGVISVGVWSSQPLPVIDSSLSWADTWNLGFTWQINSSGTIYRYGIASSTPVQCFGFIYQDSSSYTFRVVSNTSFRFYDMRGDSSGNTYHNAANASAMTGYSGYYSSTLYSLSSLDDRFVNVPVFPSLSDAMDSYRAQIGVPGFIPSPSDSVGIISSNDTGIVTIPDITSPDYVPTAIDLVTSIPWDDTYDGEDDENGIPVPWIPSDVPNVVDDIGSGIIDDAYELVLESDDPQPPINDVMLPFIPVNIPSFNFNFSGIWHYVREWVASLRSWFVALFTFWSILPYAMVVPVYATAVVVIVLGVYKRFFM